MLVVSSSVARFHFGTVMNTIFHLPSVDTLRRIAATLKSPPRAAAIFAGNTEYDRLLACRGLPHIVVPDRRQTDSLSYGMFTKLSKRFVNRLTLLSEKLWTALGNVQTIFQPDTKLTIDHNRRFVAKAHARLYRCLIATYKIRPLMTVHTNSVSRSMW